MLLKVRGTLSRELVRRCMEYGERCVLGYANNEKPESIVFATRGIENNPQEQARSKAAECGFALCFGLDPAVAVDWSSEVGPDWDVVVGGMKVDVKRTELTDAHCRLPWSNAKAGIFANKKFDALALVKTSGADYFVAGWITKERFAREHAVARPYRIDKLDEGTLFVMEETLDKVELLSGMPQTPTYRNNHLCHCGKPGTRACGFGPISELEWFCAEHDRS